MAILCISNANLVPELKFPLAPPLLVGGGPPLPCCGGPPHALEDHHILVGLYRDLRSFFGFPGLYGKEELGREEGWERGFATLSSSPWALQPLSQPLPLDIQ